ncbi:MAG TPA: AMP-binding protein [Opitutus sp.]|nr:AMP-binding protein [Opitutus sp.]
MFPPFLRRRSYLPFPLELLAALVARMLYRVRCSGTEHVPPAGGALLIANHLSYVDVIVLQLASPRRIRFVGYQGLRANPFFDRCLRLSGTIAITARHPTQGIKEAVRALRAGELVCVFPEGYISRTGQLMDLKRGFEVMARQANVPVVPAAIDGLWGSVFSFAGNKYLWKSPRLKPTPVFVAFGPPLPPERATVESARVALLDLGAIAFEERPMLKRHLGREAIRALARRPGHLEVVDRTAERREVKAGQILAAVAVLARRLKTTVPEKRVGVVLPPGAGAFIANLAIIAAGKTPVNLNFTAGRAAVEAALRLGGIVTVLSADAMRAKLPGFPWPEGTRDLRAEIANAGGKKAMLPWLLAAWLLPNQWFANLLRLPHVGDRAEAALLFTSGSVGEPKGVVLTHRNILANCAQISSLSILPRSATLLGCLPLFHSMGFTVTLWYTALRGCRVVTIPSPLDTRKMIDAVKEDEVTVLVGAPTFLRPLLKKAQPAELKSLNLVVTGAEKLPEDLARHFLEQFHLEILQGYGLTETTPVSNVNQPDPPIVTETAEPQAGKRFGSVGRLLPGMSARIVHPDTGAILRHTETGIVWLRGANVFPGYLNDEEKTRAALRDGWFVTGDLGRFDEDGFLYIEGRLSRFSKIGGEMVPHVTIEQRLVELFDWDQNEKPTLAVTSVPDSTKGEAIVLLTTENVTAEEIRTRLLGAGLPGLWVPKIVHRVEAIPMLGTGKLDLKGCRELAKSLAA